MKRLREARALTQEALAARCGLSRKTIQRIERGEPVRDETLAFIAGALGVPLTDFADDAGDSQTPTGQLGLRHVRSGKHVLNHLAQTDVGRIECDVDADGEIIEPLTRLVTQLQGLMRESWGVARPPISELPLLARLQAIADMNDSLVRLERSGVRLFMGHYYRFAVVKLGLADFSGRDQRRPVVLTRLHLTRSKRERLMVPIDTEWRGGADAMEDLAPQSDFLTASEEALVLLYPKPPLRTAADDGEDYIDGAFDVLKR
ncbi:helix-turn-helix domain-containing protein [Phenylobacterium sp.]|uniref:helix-turn-helix domain-containing protein n=1 Tax=Phenylobacterium sp. TaxID=1871053 RepID=UPI00356985DC